MVIELAEISIAAGGIVAGVWGVLFQQRKAQEKAMSEVIENLQHQIDTLKNEKVNETDMKEYVQLWTAPIVKSLEHLSAEQTRTRELMEKIYEQGLSK